MLIWQEDEENFHMAPTPQERRRLMQQEWSESRPTHTGDWLNWAIVLLWGGLFAWATMYAAGWM